MTLVILSVIIKNMQKDIKDTTKNNEKNTVNDIPNILLKKGQYFSKFGHELFFTGMASAVLLLIFIVVVELTESYPGEVVDCLALDSLSFLVNILFLLTYLGISFGFVGVPIYMFGLHCLGLGQIAKNTMPKNGTETETDIKN